MNGLRKTERGWEVHVRYGGVLYFDKFTDALWAWFSY